MKRHAIGPEAHPFGMGIGAFGIGLASKFATEPAADTQASPPGSSRRRLLRARHERPRGRRTAEKRDELDHLAGDGEQLVYELAAFHVEHGDSSPCATSAADRPCARFSAVATWGRDAETGRCRARARTGTPQGLSGCGPGDRRSRPSLRRIGVWWRPGPACRTP